MSRSKSLGLDLPYILKMKCVGKLYLFIKTSWEQNAENVLVRSIGPLM